MRLGRTLLSVTALAWSGFGAVAADIPVKAPRVVEAQPQVSGYVELYGGGAWTKIADAVCLTSCFSFSDRVDGWALGGAGRATYWWSPNGSIQLDAQGEGTSYKFSSGSNFFSRSSSHSYLIGGHANWRDPQRGLIGVFGGAGDTTGSSFIAGGNSSIRHGLVGLEGQLYWGMLTLYGQVGYDSTLGSPNSLVDSIHAWFLRGTARLYVNPNFRLEGTVLYANGGADLTTIGDSSDFETWLWRAKAEYRFATAPFSIFVIYEGSRTTNDRASFDGSGSTRVTDNRILAGLRLYLGENTLQWNDRRGTTLDIIAPHSVPSMNLNGGIGADR